MLPDVQLTKQVSWPSSVTLREPLFPLPPTEPLEHARRQCPHLYNAYNASMLAQGRTMPSFAYDHAAATALHRALAQLPIRTYIWPCIHYIHDVCDWTHFELAVNSASKARPGFGSVPLGACDTLRSARSSHAASDAVGMQRSIMQLMTSPPLIAQTAMQLPQAGFVCTCRELS